MTLARTEQDTNPYTLHAGTEAREGVGQTSARHSPDPGARQLNRDHERIGEQDTVHATS
jgi:hypothetical protein